MSFLGGEVAQSYHPFGKTPKENILQSRNGTSDRFARRPVARSAEGDALATAGKDLLRSLFA